MRVECIGSAVEGEIEIDASPQSVFEAFTDPLQLASWWGSEDTYSTSNWQVDLRPGGAWSCDASSAAGGPKSLVHGVYTEVDPPRVLAFTWNPSWDSATGTVVRIIFEATGSGTRVRLFHTGFEGFAESQKGHSQGWSRVLGWLREKFQLQGA